MQSTWKNIHFGVILAYKPKMILTNISYSQ